MEYKAAVGPPGLYGLIGAHQFCVMVKAGLREHHTMLDFGCGSLRGGKYFINYLQPDHYVGIDPDIDLVQDGIRYELTDDVWCLKNPDFHYWDDFRFAERLGRKFDFILAQSVLTHAGRDVAEIIVKEAFNSLLPDGLFVATVFLAGISSNLTGWLGNGVAAYTEQDIWLILSSAGFKDISIRDFGHPVGQLWIIARREPENV